jgi:hypothetical protein
MPSPNTLLIDADKIVVSAAPKTPYSAPQLRVFGTVSSLTESTGPNPLSDASQPTRKPAGSDRSIKENIVRIGDHPLGFGLYLFDYKAQYRDSCGANRQFGVMADEVVLLVPGAVSVHDLGYKQVDYRMLGIDLSDSAYTRH